MTYRWVRSRRSAPVDIALSLIGIPSRLAKAGKLTGGVVLDLLRTLKAMARLEIPEVVPVLERGATEIFQNFNYGQGVNLIRESEGLMSALARADPDFLRRLVETSSSLPGKNLRALVRAIRRVEGKNSPLLSQIADLEGCPDEVKRHILTIRGI